LPKENSKYKLEWSFCKYLWEGHVVIEKDQIGLIN
jgi:hypothetical protein